MTMTSGAEGVDLQPFGAQPKITLGGSPMPDHQLSSLLSMEVETVIGRPDSCEIHFLQGMDEQGTPSDDVPATWKPGAALKVELGADVLFDGEITSVDFAGTTTEPTRTVLVAYDKRHRLYRHEQTKVFLDRTFGEMVASLVAEHGLPAPVLDDLPTTPVPHYLYQGTPGDLIDWLCGEYGLYCLNKAGKMNICDASGLTEDAATIRASVEMYEYRLRQTTSADVAKAIVRNWDPKQKAAVVGESSRAAALPDDMVQSTAAQSAFSHEDSAIASSYAMSANDAVALAKGMATRNVDAGMQLDATCSLLPKAAAGKIVTVEGVPTRFKGRYRLTSVRHVFDQTEGGRTHLTCRGADDPTVTGLLEQAVNRGNHGPPVARDLGVRPAVVTKIAEDGDANAIGNAGEVKVKMPWLGDSTESHWLRVVTVGAGKDRGLFVLPEIDDEVLVVFEQGDARRGYVLGGLYNGQDQPRPTQSDAVDGGKVEKRSFTTRINSRLLFDDTGGKEAVELAAGTENFVLRFEQSKGLTVTNTGSGNVITLTADGDITVESKTGGLNLKAQNDIVISSAAGKISLSASAGDITGDAMNVKLNGSIGAELKGNATAKVESSGQTAVKGAMVMIN